jgi:CHAD domain-containing protein
MRVSSRRLRECLQLFQTFYTGKKLRKILSRVKQLTDVLGIAREVDVNLAVLTAYRPKGSPLALTAHEYLLEIMALEQARHRKKMLKAFDKLSLKRLESDLLEFTQTGSDSSRTSNLEAIGSQDVELNGFLSQTAQLLNDRAAPILSDHPSADSWAVNSDQQLHRLRIRVKKLRYRLELLNPLHQNAFDRVIESAKKLQEISGKVHDYSVVIELLSKQQVRLIDKSRSRLAKGCQKAVNDLGEMKQLYWQQIEPAYQTFVEQMSGFLPSKPIALPLNQDHISEEKSYRETSSACNRNVNLLAADSNTLSQKKSVYR